MDLKDICIIKILALKSSEKPAIEKLCDLSLIFDSLNTIKNKDRRRDLEKELKIIVKYGRNDRSVNY